MADLDESWDSMAEDVDNLKEQVNRGDRVGSLKEMCLKKIADTIHCTNCPGYHKPRPYVPGIQKDNLKGDPFKDLTIGLMHSLHLVLEERNCCFKNPRLLACLVSENCEKVNANFDEDEYWSSRDERDMEVLVNRIAEKGKRLRELTLLLKHRPDASAKDVGLDPVRTMFTNLPNLTVLNISYNSMDNVVLAAIGAHCPHLRKLTLRSRLRFLNDDGIRYLCDSTLAPGPNQEKYGQCKKITHLELKGWFFCSVTALLLLPELVYMDDGMNEICSTVTDWLQERENQTLKLQYLKMNMYFWYENWNLPRIIQAIPDITNLTFQTHILTDVDEFLKLKNVKCIRFNGVEGLKPTHLTLLITNFKNQLTKLEISNYEKKIDISIIGYECQVLSELSLVRSDFTNEMKFKLIPFAHFVTLKKFYTRMLDENFFIIPEVALKCILSSPCLENLSMELCQSADEVLSWLIQESRRREGILSRLEELTVSNVSELHVKQIICLAPKLRKVNLSDMPGYTVRDFLQQNGLNHCKIVTHDFGFPDGL